MNAIVISDIHGDLITLNEIIDKIYKFNVDKLIILGDFCSYYNDSLDIAERLNDFKSIIIGVKGNVDTDVFISNIDIDLPSVQSIKFNDHLITLTHGHIYNPHNMPNNHGEIFLSGHTHRKSLSKINNTIVANPGSIGRPRDGSKSYILITNTGIYLKDMNDEIIEFIKF